MSKKKFTYKDFYYVVVSVPSKAETKMICAYCLKEDISQFEWYSEIQARFEIAKTLGKDDDFAYDISNNRRVEIMSLSDNDKIYAEWIIKASLKKIGLVTS